MKEPRKMCKEFNTKQIKECNFNAIQLEKYPPPPKKKKIEFNAKQIKECNLNASQLEKYPSPPQKKKKFSGSVRAG